MVLPGLSGGPDRWYMKSLVKTLLADGFDVVIFNNRGQGDIEYTSSKFADLTSTEEFDKALTFVRDQVGKDAELVGVGLSTGACTLLKIAGQQKENFPLRALVSVGNPFDFWTAINLMRGK